MLHYFGFTIQLVMLRIFNVKVKNLAFDTSKIYHKCMVFYEKLRFDIIGRYASIYYKVRRTTHRATPVLGYAASLCSFMIDTPSYTF